MRTKGEKLTTRDPCWAAALLALGGHLQSVTMSYYDGEHRAEFTVTGVPEVSEDATMKVQTFFRHLRSVRRKLWDLKEEEEFRR